MKTLTTILAAAALALGLASTAEAGLSVRLPSTPSLAPSLVHKAGCYDDCEEYLEAAQEAREEVQEQAAEYAEEAEEYGYRPHRGRRHARTEPSARYEKPAAAERTPKSKIAEESPKASDKASESSEGKSKVAANAKGTCKQYFPSIGQSLSVACE